MKAKLVVAGALGFLIYKESSFNVEVGHRALIFNKLSGVMDDVYAEGHHFKVPYRDAVIMMNVRTQATEVQSSCVTTDLE